MKKKILIIGPIVDFGGREVMTNLLFNSLKENYYPTVFSTVNITPNSVALKGLKKNQWTALPYLLYKYSFLVKLSSLLTKYIHKREEPVYFFVRNKLTKSFFDFKSVEIKIISKFLKESDFIIYCDEISGKWLQTIVEITEKYNIPLLLRLTGQIKSVPNFLNSKNINVLAHSKENVHLIKSCFTAKIWNIDQTSELEKELLKLKINESHRLVYGFLGRFSEEKGIKQLLSVFEKNQKQLVIAGNGPLLDDVIDFIEKNEKSCYLGELMPQQLLNFFSRVDVLVISSFEEGGPIVGIEAMAAGKLIISTRVGAMPERLEKTDNDFWFSHNEKEGLQIAIDQVESLSKIRRLEIRKKNRNKYIEYNSMKYIRTQYLDLIDKLIH